MLTQSSGKLFFLCDGYVLCVASEGNFGCSCKPEMVRTEVHHTLLKHLKKVFFVFLWKIGYYYLSKTVRTFK